MKDDDAKLQMLVARTATDIRGKLLAQAYVIVRREGLKLNVDSIDGVTLIRDDAFYQKDPRRINVDVHHSTVKRSWIG